jgi:hypothetical protein|tara:strand:+ start:793 stop:1374 length:582 start_codon:yes stop_codon:yes gene_type:complete
MSQTQNNKKINKYVVTAKESKLSLGDGDSINGDLTVGEGAGFDSTVAVTGVTTLSSTLAVTGLTTLAGGVSFSGSFGFQIQEVTSTQETVASQVGAVSISASNGTFINLESFASASAIGACQLPSLSSTTPGTTLFIYANSGSGFMEIFPNTGDKIGPAGDNAGITVVGNTISMFTALDDAEWIGAEFPAIVA